MHDGRYRDTIYYSILEDEWTGVRRRLRCLIEGGDEAGGEDERAVANHAR